MIRSAARPNPVPIRVSVAQCDGIGCGNEQDLLEGEALPVGWSELNVREFDRPDLRRLLICPVCTHAVLRRATS